MAVNQDRLVNVMKCSWFKKISFKNILTSARSQYYNRKIKICKGNQRTFFIVGNKVLYKNKTVFPTQTKIESFFNNFCQKILNVHDEFPSITLSQGIPLVEESCMSMIDRGKALTGTNIRQLLKRLSNAFCADNPLPTWLMKGSQDVLISPITKILNKTLCLDVFLRSMKMMMMMMTMISVLWPLVCTF